MRRSLLLLIFVLLPAPVQGQDLSSSHEAQVIDRAMTEVVRKTEPAVVSILVSRSEDYGRLLKDTPPADQPGELGGFDRKKAKQVLSEMIKDEKRLEALLRRLDLGDMENVPESYGSGVAIATPGLILTNFHVVRDATKIYIRLPGGKGSYANIHAADYRSDLAVLRMLDSSVHPEVFLRPGNESVHKGQLIIALANPYAPGFRDAGPRASWGLISNLHRKLPQGRTPAENDKWTLNQLGTLIQVDRSLPVGSSGGVLLNLKGNLVGLITSLGGISGDPGGAFAVPLDSYMSRIIDVLKKGEEVDYGFLGIQFHFFGDPRFRNQPRPATGAWLGGVVEGSPAGRAGLARGDIIEAVDDLAIRDDDDLRLAIGRALAGTTVQLKVHSRPETIPVTLVKALPMEGIIASVKHQFARGLRVDYTSILVQRGPAAPIPGGVYVREVEKGSPADSAHLQDAIITKVAGQEVHTPAEFYEIMPKSGRVELTLAGSDDQQRERRVTLD
jgi:serine protease Do